MTFDVLSQISSTNKISKWKWLYSTEFFPAQHSMLRLFFFLSCFHFILFFTLCCCSWFHDFLFQRICMRKMGSVCVCGKWATPQMEKLYGKTKYYNRYNGGKTGTKKTFVLAKATLCITFSIKWLFESKKVCIQMAWMHWCSYFNIGMLFLCLELFCFLNENKLFSQCLFFINHYLVVMWNSKSWISSFFSVLSSLFASKQIIK